jgi:Ca-activated chloride channel family protein
VKAARHVALVAIACGVALAQDARPRRGFEIRIVEPAQEAIVLGKTTIIAEVDVADPELVDRVEFLVGDEIVFVDREPPWEVVHDFGEVSRAWVIRAVAHHVEGVTVSDSVVARKIPFVTIERVNRVILWVTAQDASGALITQLDRADLRVTEEGAPQEILEFYREDRPITAAILIDTSGSMQEEMEEIHSAAGAFVDSLREADRALVIDFDDKVFLIQDLTSDREALKSAIQSTEALGASALYDALHAAYRKIGKIDGRKAIVVLSDGEDTSSQFPFARLREEAVANDAIIYTIALEVQGVGGLKKGVLRELAEATGGRFFLVKKGAELGEVYQRIAEELRAQWYLTYSTENDVFDGRWVDIRVEHANPDVDIRSRSGYFAVRSGGG